ncbi:MAG: BLUF domain-containing protein [Zetaproteobacteria bacterium]|nr:MAG: BLUF domain-containing protein [Zetaproteobacteria bacterium]
MLVRLLYASRSASEIDETLIASILDHSRKYNREHGITGILCAYTPGNVFLQLLEGGRDAVNALYANIVRDPRHSDVTLLDYAEITERRFASWRMGRVNLNRVNQGTILRFSESAILDPFAMSGPTALALLDELTSTAAIVSGEGS